MESADLSLRDIARAVGISESALRTIAENHSEYFKPPRRKLVKGKLRRIEAPFSGHKRRLRRKHRFLQREFKAHRCAHGGVKGKSCFTAARRHAGRRFVITRDIKNCYPSISTEGMLAKLLGLGFPHETALVLADLFCVRGHLAQGSPVSSDALNLFLHDVDVELSAAANRLGARYHRTYDDMVMSVNSVEHVAEVERLLEQAIERNGLEVSEKKKESGLQPFHREQRVHNLVVNGKRGVGIPKEQQEKARELAESYVRGARAVAADSLEALARKRARIVGYLCHFRQADYSNAKHIDRLLKAGDRHVARRLKERGLQPYKKKWWVVAGKRNEPARLRKLWKRSMEAKRGLSAA